MRPIILLFAILIQVGSSRSDAQNTWTQKADFGGISREEAVGFSIGDKGYLGTGYDGTTVLKDFWEFEPITNTWTQKADFGGVARMGAVGLSIGGKGYIGTGGNTLKDFWEYDPSTNAWLQKADFGGPARYWATGFSIGDKGYIGLGSTFSGDRKDFYEYDPATDSWTQKADFQAKRMGAVGFSIGDKGYVGTGSYTKQFWQYDPATDTWQVLPDLPAIGRQFAVGFSIGGKGYIGTGIDLFLNLTTDFYEYDTATGSWTQVEDFAGSGRWFAVGFSIGNMGYVGTGADSIGDGTGSGFKKDFWEYTPDCTVPTDLTTTNITSTNVQLNWEAVATATKYNIRYKRDSVGAPWISKSVTSTSKTITGLLPNSKYRWKVKSVCGNVKSEFSSTVKFTTLPLRIEHAASQQTALAVYPNPIKLSTTVSFKTEATGNVSVTLLDFAGRRLQNLIEAHLESGSYSVPFNCEELNSGLYFLEMKTATRVLP